MLQWKSATNDTHIAGYRQSAGRRPESCRPKMEPARAAWPHWLGIDPTAIQVQPAPSMGVAALAIALVQSENWTAGTHLPKRPDNDSMEPCSRKAMRRWRQGDPVRSWSHHHRAPCNRFPGGSSLRRDSRSVATTSSSGQASDRYRRRLLDCCGRFHRSGRYGGSRRYRRCARGGCEGRRAGPGRGGQSCTPIAKNERLRNPAGISGRQHESGRAICVPEFRGSLAAPGRFKAFYAWVRTGAKWMIARESKEA